MNDAMAEVKGTIFATIGRTKDPTEQYFRSWSKEQMAQLLVDSGTEIKGQARYYNMLYTFEDRPYERLLTACMSQFR